MTDDRAAFERWLRDYAACSVLLAATGERPDRRHLLGALTRLTGQQRASGYVCVLMEHRLGDEIPALIGWTPDPRRTWAAHLSGLARTGDTDPHSTAAYSRWRRRLLREGHGTARHDLLLYVVGAAEAESARLTHLAAGAYPLPLLDA